jgi:hypothetical protein
LILTRAFRFAVIVAATWGAWGCGSAPQTAAPGELPSGAAQPVFRTLEVWPVLVPCVGVGRRTCFRVRETADAPWTLMYSDIAGFSYQPGYLYTIRIREDAVANPPADGSSIRRTVVAVLSRTPAPPPS